MTKTLYILVALMLAMTTAACGDDSSSDGDGASGTGGDGDGDGDAGGDGNGDGDGDGDEFLAEAGDGWKTLVTGDWTLPAETEGYVCVFLTIPQDTYVSGMKPLIPPGTHHTVLSIDEVPEHEDGVEECDAFTNGERQLGGSGVGTAAYEYPDGVAMELKAGSQITLNLHLFNTNEDELEGTSGLLIKTMKKADVVHKAETILAGTLDLEIPPGRITQSGTCTFQHDATIFSILPHMHQTGVHLKAVAHSTTMGDVVLYDDDYTFEDQQVYRLDMIEMKEGDTVDVDCTYENDREETIHWGDSSLAEMCFAGLARFPAGDTGAACTN